MPDPAESAAPETVAVVVPQPGMTRADTTAHDDRIRKYLMFVVFTQFALIIGGIVAMFAFLAYHNIELGTAKSSIISMIVQAEIGFGSAAVFYYWGSSSGSTAKGVSQEKRLLSNP